MVKLRFINPSLESQAKDKPVSTVLQLHVTKGQEQLFPWASGRPVGTCMVFGFVHALSGTTVKHKARGHEITPPFWQ